MKKTKVNLKYKGYLLEITWYGVDVAEPWRPYKYYALCKVPLSEAFQYIEDNPAPDPVALGWDILACLDQKGGLI